MKAPAALLLSLILGLASLRSTPRPSENSATADSAHALINTCLITGDVKKLGAFYALVLQIEPRKTGDDYLEFHTSAGTLALFSADAQERYIPGSAKPGQNHSAILEFKVGNVDQEYARLHALVKVWVKGPSTQPWGTRSIYFRDPDGNLVDFFTPAASPN